MGLFRKYINQTRKPEGFLGKLMIKGMNTGHSKLTDWGLGHVRSVDPADIIDLGCGGGRNVAELLKMYPSAHVTGLDYSELSVQEASAKNKSAIAAGRCSIVQGDVSDIDMEPESFDFALANETVYFWPGLEKCFGEVAKIMRPGGWFVIINESDGIDKTGLKFEKMIDGMKVYTAGEIKEALLKAGFSTAKDAHHDKLPWIVVAARK